MTAPIQQNLEAIDQGVALLGRLRRVAAPANANIGNAGPDVPPDFGVAPSTLEHQKHQAACAR